MELSSEVIASHSTPRKFEPARPQASAPEGTMTDRWKHFQGQVVGGKFPLSQYLGGTDHSAVFLTERPQGEPRKAAIKLIPADSEKAARQLSRWAEAEKMSNPQLIRLFEMGRCRLEKEQFLYLVMEYAEEELSQVAATRALTPRECQEMLPAVLEGLAYIHRQGFVHGHLKPSNILAVEDKVKLSCDGLCLAGEAGSALGAPSVYDPPEIATEGLSPATDVWSLGVTLVEVLTRKVPVLDAGRTDPILPPSMPTPLADIVRHCVRLGSKQRWTVADITARLARAPKPPEQAQVEPLDLGGGRKPYLILVAGIAIILAVVIATVLFTSSKKTAAPDTAAVPPAKQLASKAPAVAAPPAVVKASPALVAKAPAVSSPAQTAVVHEVVPRVPQSARNTIHGTVRVRIRVALDQAGNVRLARFDSRGPSQYFARLAMQAAQGWKFTPPRTDGPNEAREWLLRFEFRRDSTHVVPSPVRG